MTYVGPKGVASLHKLLSEPDGATGNTDIERLSDQIDDAQAKFEVAAHTDSIAKGDKVYIVNSAVNSPREFDSETPGSLRTPRKPTYSGDRCTNTPSKCAATHDGFRPTHVQNSAEDYQKTQRTIKLIGKSSH
eukprot:COSAG06_NODE_3541_length_5207_cov_125.451057_1_plen_132_part_10